jgi:hypothetical protein
METWPIDHQVEISSASQALSHTRTSGQGLRPNDEAMMDQWVLTGHL